MPNDVRTSLDIREHRLDNGLRVVLNPDPAVPAVAIGISYDVGFRSEPKGRTGFAHLFEHLLFQGSENAPKPTFDTVMEANGGVNNGQTRMDSTFYIDIVPPHVLELALFLEADRMRALALTEENLRNQVDVVKEEVRLNVHNAPYGGFPWLDLPQAAFRTYPNGHNFYGEFADLEAATLDDAAEFYETYYPPGNAVIALAGAIDPRQALDLVDKHLGAVPARTPAPLGDWSEPVPKQERRVVRHDAHAPEPAVALGYRVPDPVAEFDDYLALLLAAEVLGSGDASRLHQRLVKHDRVATQVSAAVGFDDPFTVRGPTLLELTVHYTGKADPARVLGPLDEEVASLVEDGVADEELDRFRSSFVSNYLREVDNLFSRVDHLATVALVRGSATVANEIAPAAARVDADRVRCVAAKWLRPATRTVVDLRPGTGPRRKRK